MPSCETSSALIRPGHLPVDGGGVPAIACRSAGAVGARGGR